MTKKEVKNRSTVLIQKKVDVGIAWNGYDNALLLVTRTIDRVMTGEILIKDLVVSKILRQDLYKGGYGSGWSDDPSPMKHEKKPEEVV
ncbi:MAG: hypothetical protein WA323_22115 [Candidatus Nitrosopolaris sp.]